MFLSSRLYVTDCEKKYEIQTASFSKESGLPSCKHASRFLTDEEKTAKFGDCSGMHIKSCGHAR